MDKNTLVNYLCELNDLNAAGKWETLHFMFFRTFIIPIVSYNLNCFGKVYVVALSTFYETCILCYELTDYISDTQAQGVYFF